MMPSHWKSKETKLSKEEMQVFSRGIEEVLQNTEKPMKVPFPLRQRFKKGQAKNQQMCLLLYPKGSIPLRWENVELFPYD